MGQKIISALLEFQNLVCAPRTEESKLHFFAIFPSFWKFHFFINLVRSVGLRSFKKQNGELSVAHLLVFFKFDLECTEAEEEAKLR